MPSIFDLSGNRTGYLISVRNQLSTKYRKHSCASVAASRKSPNAPLPGGRDKSGVGCPRKQISSLCLHKAINTRLSSRLPIHWLLMPFCPNLSKVERKEEEQIYAKANMRSWKSVLSTESICFSMPFILRRRCCGVF